MPLVTRTAVSGNIFRQTTEPPDWLNGDIWVDTDNSQCFVNLAGTALQFGAGTLNAGDILFSDSDESLATLAKGTADQHLIMNSGATAPEWQTFAGITLTNQRDELTSNFTTTSTSLVDVTGMAITVPNRTDGKFSMSSTIYVRGTAGDDCFLAYLDDVTAESLGTAWISTSNETMNLSIPLTGNLGGQVVKIQTKTSASQVEIRGNAANDVSVMESLEIS